MTSVMCGSPSLAGLCQHLPSAVCQQYLHVPGLLHSEGLSPTECSVGACVSMCACNVHNKFIGNHVDISPPMSYILQTLDTHECAGENAQKGTAGGMH